MVNQILAHTPYELIHYTQEQGIIVEEPEIARAQADGQAAPPLSLAPVSGLYRRPANFSRRAR
ncbi:MAG TPA: hypothetical protein VFJ24_08830 [Gaiellales bacterium]|nr:hypothetical protein [Gaiellales bacterium]